MEKNDPDLHDVATALVKPEMNLYERLFMRAYDIEMVQEMDEHDQVTAMRSRLVPKDDDLVQAYRLLIEMRKTLDLCARQFRTYGRTEQHRRATEHLSLVENIKLRESEDRNLGIAAIVENMLADAPQLPAGGWQPISTAPQDGSPIRLLGRMEGGQPYVETGRWANIVWSVQSKPGYGPPTHWMMLEALPETF